MSRLAVGREVAKQVYIAERLAPPSSLAEVQSITTQAYAKAQDPRFWQEAIRTGQAWKMGVYALEAYCASALVGSLTLRKSSSRSARSSVGAASSATP